MTLITMVQESSKSLIVVRQASIHVSRDAFLSFFQDAYDKQFVAEVYSSPEITLSKLKEGTGLSKVRLTYTSSQSFKTYANALQIMNDFKVSLKIQF